MSLISNILSNSLNDIATLSEVKSNASKSLIFKSRDDELGQSYNKSYGLIPTKNGIICLFNISGKKK